MRRMMKAASAATSAKRSKILPKERSKGVSDLLKDQVQVSCCA